MLYSQFKEIEGHGVIQVLLRHKGWAELDCKKNKEEGVYELILPKDLEKPMYISFTGDKDKNKVLMDLFNSDFDKLPKGIQKQIEQIAEAKGIDNVEKTKNLHGEIVKMLMITKRGAEGISLKNVRQVHIMEPYWNDNRARQVIGRAVRAGSHLELPKTERDVRVFMYIMTFDKYSKTRVGETNDKGKGKPQRQGIDVVHDEELTSDEYVHEVSEYKRRFVGALEQIMKSVAIDCAIHKVHHPHVNACRAIPHKMTGPLYKFQDAKEDDDDELIQKKVTQEVIKYKTIGAISLKVRKEKTEEPVDKHFEIIDINGKQRLIDPVEYAKTHELYFHGKKNDAGEWRLFKKPILFVA